MTSVRVLSGLTLSSAILVITLAGQLIAVPVFLSRWGVGVYGDWLVLTGVFSSLSLLNLGVQTYVGNSLIESFVRDEYDAGRRTLHAAFRLYGVLCLAALVIVAAFTATPWTRRSLGVSHMSAGEATVVMVAYGLVAAYALVGGLIMSVLRAVGRVPRQLGYGVVERSLFIGGPVIVALAGGGPAVAAMVVAVSMVGVGGVAWLEVRALSPFAFGVRDASWRDAVRLLPPSFGFFGAAAVGPITASAITVLISRTLGATGVVTYSTALMIVNLVRQAISQVLVVIWPEVTASAAAGRDATVRRWRRLTIKVATVMSIGAASIIYFAGDGIIAVWTRRIVHTDPMLLGLLVTFLVLQSPAHVDAIYALALNRQLRVFGIYVAGAAVTLATALALVRPLGLSGVAVGLVLGQVVSTAMLFVLTCRATADPVPAVTRAFIVVAVPSVATFVVGAAALGAEPMAPATAFVVGAVLSLVVVSVAWSTWLHRDERRLLQAAVTDAWTASAVMLRGKAMSV
ncbi:MAG TPA: hypothetical protein VGM22_00510 [Methylomirabilota bacterium]